MGYLTDIQHWSFADVQLARRLTSTSEWEEWFDADTILNISPILDTGDRYIDVGGTTYAPLNLVFAFETLEDRDTFLALRTSLGVLARLGYNPKARLCVFRRAQEIASGNDGYVLLNCTFEAL